MAKLTNKVARWMNAKLARDPALGRRVAARMNELRLEEDLLALREARGLTQDQLAKLVGVTQPVIARWESGQVKNMQLKTLLRLTTALGGDLHVAIRPPHHTGSPRRATASAR